MNTKALLFAVIAVLFLSSCASTRRGSSKINPSKTTQVKEEPRRVAVKEEPAPAPVAQPVSAPVVVREERVTHVEHSGPDFRFYVILGSFRVLDNARNFRSELFQQNFTPVILENENGLYRVSVSAFNDEQSARSRIAQIRQQYPKYDDVWLLIRTR